MTFEQKVNNYIDNLNKPSFILDEVCIPENQEKLLMVVYNRSDVTTDGNKVFFKDRRTQMEIIEHFFTEYKPGEYVDCRYGYFSKKNFCKFVRNQIEAAKCHKSNHEKMKSLKVLKNLMGMLSTSKETC